jgi:hypothetical protein
MAPLAARRGEGDWGAGEGRVGRPLRRSAAARAAVRAAQQNGPITTHLDAAAAAAEGCGTVFDLKTFTCWKERDFHVHFWWS